MKSASLRTSIWAAFALLGPFAAGMPSALPAGAAEPDWDAPDRGYTSEIRPLMVRYCQECHSADNPEADVNFASFASLTDVRKQPQIWQRVGEMLDSGQMPPKDAEQPSAAERTLLDAWVHGYLTLEAQARAGDPGRVVLRRLSNAEYTYTLRDLTGIDSLDPAHEFPVDGAAGEGFTNTGNALVMSPALVTKYLDAAKDVASHMVLLPDGLRFSPYTTRRDWTDETVAQIRAFYRQFTDPRGGERVNLQGIVFDTNEGGGLPLEKYLAATLANRESLASGGKSFEAVAHDAGLSPKYLATLWRSLTSAEPSLAARGLRAAGARPNPRTPRRWPRKSASGKKGFGNSGPSVISAKSGGLKPGSNRSVRSPRSRNCASRFHRPATPPR